MCTRRQCRIVTARTLARIYPNTNSPGTIGIVGEVNEYLCSRDGQLETPDFKRDAYIVYTLLDFVKSVFDTSNVGLCNVTFEEKTRVKTLTNRHISHLASSLIFYVHRRRYIFQTRSTRTYNHTCRTSIKISY